MCGWSHLWLAKCLQRVKYEIPWKKRHKSHNIYCRKEAMASESGLIDSQLEKCGLERWNSYPSQQLCVHWIRWEPRFAEHFAPFSSPVFSGNPPLACTIPVENLLCHHSWQCSQLEPEPWSLLRYRHTVVGTSRFKSVCVENNAVN